MKITQIKVSQKSRLGLTDYNGVDLETSIYAELEEGDVPEVCLQELTGAVRESIRERAAPFLPYVVLHKANGKPSVEVTELFQGKAILKDDEQKGE